MSDSTIKAQIRAVVFGIFGLIVAVVLIRIVLKLVGANPDASLVRFWYDFTNFFVGLFRNTYPLLQDSLLKINIELFSVMALIFYMLLAFLVQKAFVSFTEPDAVEISKSIIDSIFKIVEFLLILRFVFKLTGASVVSPFVPFIYSASAVVYEPFRGILPTINVGNTGIVIESSTLIAIIIIVIFDAVFEGVIDNLTGHRKKGLEYNSNPNLPAAPAPHQVAPMPQNNQPAQNITINMPHPTQQQQPQPVVVDRRTVQVIHPQTPHYYPGYGQNNLNTQRPQQQLQGGPQYWPQQPQPGPNQPGSRADYNGPREA